MLLVSLLGALFFSSLGSALATGLGRQQNNTVCIVEPATNGSDSAPVINDAFATCGHNGDQSRGQVIFSNTTYTIASVMNTTGLSNVDVILEGTLFWDNSNITYWLDNSLPVGYQNQSSAWLFGGTNLTFTGPGTFDGNGDAWYDYANGTSNLARRPHQLTIGNTTNSIFSNLTFLRSQMWTMTVIHSSDVLLENIYVNNTSTGGTTSSNTDGADTIYANNIKFSNWTVINGDDSIACKANSTNILIANSTFINGQGFALGSIGQYPNVFETVENITLSNISCLNTSYAAYLKSWTGVEEGYPPNGGGAGLGYAQNLTFEDFYVEGIKKTPFVITQCTSYNGLQGDCDTSLFQMRNVTLRDWTGTGVGNTTVSLQCSADAPCGTIEMDGVVIVDMNNTMVQGGFLCNNTVAVSGFECTGLVTTVNNNS